MKLTQLLLCKTPFTPSYEHLVTGCSSTEFYNKLASEGSTITISPSLTPNITFRPVRETDREIVFSVNMLGENASYIKPQDFNYVATYEQNPTSRRFWFIESYNVDNAGAYPTVTFYCSIDYWHSYCLVSAENFINQRIIHTTQNGSNLNNVYFSDGESTPHEVSIISEDRVLWGRVRINTITYSDRYDELHFGTVLDGSLSHAYIPLGFVKNNVVKFFDSDSMIHPSITMRMNYKEITLSGNTASATEKPAGILSLSRADTEFDVMMVSNFDTLESFDLTYLPPFRYSFTETGTLPTITIIDKCNAVNISYSVDSPVYLITPPENKSVLTKTIEYNTNIPSPTPSSPDVYFYNRYPYRYYSVVLGEKEFNVNYPVTSFKIQITNNGSGNSASCSLYANDRLIEDNIEISLSVPLPITKDQAGQIEAIYGSGYRMNKLLTSFIPKVMSAVSTKGKSMIKDVPSGFLSAYEYTREDNIPTTVYSPTSQSSQISYGDYPFIKLYSIRPGYEKCITSKLKMIGEPVDYFDNPIQVNHVYFDYVRTSNCTTLSDILNIRGNDSLSSAFNRGVYLWHFHDYESYISNFVGNFSLINSNLEV